MGPMSIEEQQMDDNAGASHETGVGRSGSEQRGSTRADFLKRVAAGGVAVGGVSPASFISRVASVAR